MMADGDRIKVSQAIVVEGRDDVEAVSKACDALLIPTHGFGITGETWEVLAKAYEEKGLIILTDPDSAGERIRRHLTKQFPDAIQCFLAREDAVRGDDIGIENAGPEAIGKAVLRALEISGRTAAGSDDGTEEVTYSDLFRLGLAGTDGASELRAEVCRKLGIGYGNAGAMCKKLKGFGIGINELEETIREIRKDT